MATLIQQPADNKLFERIQTLEKDLAQARLGQSSNGRTNSNSAAPSVPQPPAPSVPNPNVTADSLKKFERGTKAKHLGTDAPLAATSKDVTSWIKRILSTQIAKKIPSVTNEIKECLKQVQEDHTDLALRVLIGWGLPVALAGNLTLDVALKVLAGVSLI